MRILRDRAGEILLCLEDGAAYVVGLGVARAETDGSVSGSRLVSPGCVGVEQTREPRSPGCPHHEKQHEKENCDRSSAQPAPGCLVTICLIQHNFVVAK